MIFVRRIPPELTYDIRHIVLRAGLPRESCYWDSDRAPGAFHLGGWADGRQVGVSTFQPEEDPGLPGAPAFRLRGMAVLPEARGEGVGSLMLLAGEDEVFRAGVTAMWCNARAGAVPFYERNGWKAYGGRFEIPGAGPHFLMRKTLAPRECSSRPE